MWVSATFDRLRGGQLLTGAAPWLALAEAAGPTKTTGPLTQDWLLPSQWDPTQLGINLFSHDARWSRRVRETLVRSAHELGADIEALLEEGGELHWHGGMAWQRGGGVVKAYVAGPSLLLGDVAMSLGVVADEDVFALGFDVTRDGLSRARCYRRAHTVVQNTQWPGYPAWATLEPRGLSHRVVASLDPPHASIAKRSFDHIFGPEAPIGSLEDLAQEMARIEPRCSPSFDVRILRDLEALLARDELVVRPVSYEVDVLANGEVRTDALITVGEPSSLVASM